MQKFPIKGFNEGLLISIGEGNWEELQSALLDQIDAKSSFFTKAKIAIDVGERELKAAQMTTLRKVLGEREIKLFAVLSTAKRTESNALTLGLSTRASLMKETESKLSAAIMEGEPGLVIQKTIRSGTTIAFDGHVTVHGDINPGAEIKCAGSVFVWGKLRGSVHAGMEGAHDCVVCAMEFDPIKLRIANITMKNNKLLRKLKKKPVKVSIEEDNLVLDYWDS